MRIWKYRSAGRPRARQSELKPFRGTGDVPGNARRPRGNEGVGEHVRTRFQSGLGPGEIAEQRFRTERRKPVSSAGPVWKSEPFRKSIQPFDLMSRRHPLFVNQSLQTFIRGSNDVPASSRRHSFRSEIYFFFLATLRVFFAVFFTALFAFFAFLAFLAMLPS